MTSSWGNGHGTTYRALTHALAERGHDIVFFERNVEWYASNRDLPNPEWCDVVLYDDWKQALSEIQRELRDADVAVAGSYFPDGIEVIDRIADSAAVKVFYDID